MGVFKISKQMQRMSEFLFKQVHRKSYQLRETENKDDKICVVRQHC